MFDLCKRPFQHDGRLCIDHFQQPEHRDEGADRTDHRDGSAEYGIRSLWNECGWSALSAFLVYACTGRGIGAAVHADSLEERYV